MEKKQVDLYVNLWQSDLKAISTNAVEVPKVCANCRYNSDHPEKLLGWSVALWWYPITLPSKIKNQVHQNESTRVISELSIGNIGYPTLLGARYSNIPAYTSRLQPEPLFQKVSCLHNGTPLPSPSYHPQKQGASHVAAVYFGSTPHSVRVTTRIMTPLVGNLKRDLHLSLSLGWGEPTTPAPAPEVHTECWDELHLRKPGNSMPWVENLTKKHLELVSLMRKVFKLMLKNILWPGLLTTAHLSL